MWPLTTIRNYECQPMNNLESVVSIEAGRKAPMGEGQYTFVTASGQDEVRVYLQGISLQLFLGAIHMVGGGQGNCIFNVNEYIVGYNNWFGELANPRPSISSQRWLSEAIHLVSGVKK